MRHRARKMRRVRLQLDGGWVLSPAIATETLAPDRAVRRVLGEQRGRIRKTKGLYR